MSTENAGRSAEAEPLWTDEQISDELMELQSFVMVETKHLPTVHAVARLRRQVDRRMRAATVPPGPCWHDSGMTWPTAGHAGARHRRLDR